MELTEARVALEAMCTRCINHEQCLGTGCQPKNEIKKTIEEAEVYKKALDWLAGRCEVLDMIANPTFESVCFKAKRWKEIALQKAREDNV